MCVIFLFLGILMQLTAEVTVTEEFDSAVTSVAAF